MLSKNILHHNIFKINKNRCILSYVYMYIFKFILPNEIYFIKLKSTLLYITNSIFN